MKLYATGFLLLIIFTDSGLVKHGGEFDSADDCQDGWEHSVKPLLECRLKKAKPDCFIECGQPIGFCVQAERLLAPGVIFPMRKESKEPC